MHCEYCDVEVTTYPQNGICVHCGGRLPPKPVVQPVSNPVQPFAQPIVQPVYIPVQPRVQFMPGVNCCPKCRNIRLVHATRGFSWGLAILGFFLFPVFGLLLGFCGSKKPRVKCENCGHKWKRN